MKYDSYSYLWPPRPVQAIDPAMLATVERQGYCAQYKKNGTCNIIAVSPEGEIIAKSRHADDHKLWVPNRDKMKAFTSLRGGGWYVFVAELLHSKGTGHRDVNYIHDVLVHNGEYLVGVSQHNRWNILYQTFNVEDRPSVYSHWIIDDYTWVAKQLTSGFAKAYENIDQPEDEGLVLKNPNVPLAFCSREKANNAGLLKSRKAHKNFSF